ncbi:hypothetical protein EV193_101752 [Herbihabitans rhizosphaerae]|uniref:Uncharacterized protein n=1 Tax=Herbihabitans rhizosphaerae TaxID=1872711 RepID=A0A4Q7L8Y2_9PSEU|nr:hypothetical protein [Herbihabitans rhizosphaerae]RZS44872.1 hypothetical protein EV193_101752 [Herbihabitans rhizosphaerae]
MALESIKQSRPAMVMTSIVAGLLIFALAFGAVQLFSGKETPPKASASPANRPTPMPLTPPPPATPVSGPLPQGAPAALPLPPAPPAKAPAKRPAKPVKKAPKKVVKRKTVKRAPVGKAKKKTVRTVSCVCTTKAQTKQKAQRKIQRQVPVKTIVRTVPVVHTKIVHVPVAVPTKPAFITFTTKKSHDKKYQLRIDLPMFKF